MALSSHCRYQGRRKHAGSALSRLLCFLVRPNQKVTSIRRSEISTPHPTGVWWRELRKEGLLACKDLAGDGVGFIRLEDACKGQRREEAWAGPAGHSISRLSVGKRVGMGGRKKARWERARTAETQPKKLPEAEKTAQPRRVFSSLFLVQACFLTVRLFLISPFVGCILIMAWTASLPGGQSE